MSNSAIDHPQISVADVEHAQTCSEALLAEARRQGASDAEVVYDYSVGYDVSVRLGEIETLESSQQRHLVVACFKGNKRGVASTSDDSKAAMQEVVSRALAIATELEQDPHAGLARSSQMATDIVDLDNYHPWPLSVSDAVDYALTCESAGRQDSRIVNSEGATVGNHVGVHWYANSAGFSQGYRGSSHANSCVVIASDGEGMQRDYWYDSHCQAGQLASPVAVGSEAARRALGRLGGRKLTTGQYPVIYAPTVAKSLLAHFIGAISGGNLYRKNSFLCDAIGQSLFPDWVTIGEQPQLPGLGSSVAFDGDGLATREQNFVEAGRLSSYALGLYSARQLGLEPTGNGSGVHNLSISHSNQTQQQMLAQMGNGLLITELMGSAVNAITGDYSRGAAGFWVENGVISHPVEEFTLAGRLQDMYAALLASGTDVDQRGRIHCGSLMLASMDVAGE